MQRDRNNAVKRTTIFAIAALLLTATAMSALIAAITDTKDSGPGSSTFTRDCSGIATGTPISLPTPPPCIGEYVISQIEDSCVPGETDIGNHGDDTVTSVALPFPYTLYDHTFNSINLSSNGNAQFTTTDNAETN